jgi:hypothetical protein
VLKDPETGGASFEAFSCEVEPERDAVRVRAIGALDIAGVPVLRAQIDELVASASGASWSTCASCTSWTRRGCA